MTNWRRKWICYVLVVVMALTGTSVCAFAAPNEEGDENGTTEAVETELEAFDEGESVEAVENDEAAEAAETTVATIEISAVIDRETNTCTISWPAVEADKYVIEYGEVSQEITGEALSYIIENYAGEVITVKAYKDGELVAKGIYSDDSVLAAVATFKPTTEQATMEIISDKIRTLNGDKGTSSKGVAYERVVDRPIDVKWEAVSGAKYYDIYRMVDEAQDEWGFDATDEKEKPYIGQWVLVEENVTDTSYHDVYRTAYHDYENQMKKYEAGEITEEPQSPGNSTWMIGGSYTYKIVAKQNENSTVAQGTAVESEVSDPAVVPNFLKKLDNLKWHVKPKTSTKLYTSRSGSKSKMTVTKTNQTDITINTRYPYRSKVTVYKKGGGTVTGFMIRKKIGPKVCAKRPDVMRGSKASANVRSGEITDRDYTVATKEKYANTFAKKTTYFIWVSRYTQKINIFKKVGGKYKLVRVCECSTGSYLNYTGTMTKKISSHLATKKKKSYYYKYLSYFWKTNSLHGPCYTYKGNLKKTPSHKTSTLGCIRTWPADAEFIYKTCGKARVRVYY